MSSQNKIVRTDIFYPNLAWLEMRKYRNASQKKVEVKSQQNCSSVDLLKKSGVSHLLNLLHVFLEEMSLTANFRNLPYE